MTVRYQRSTVHTVADIRAIADHAGSQRDDRPAIDIATVGEHHATPAEARRAARELIAGTA